MPTIPQPRFYVYVLARPNGKPFYVGKGQRDRVYDHEAEARSGHRCHKCNVIRKIWRTGGKVQRYVVFATDDEQAAYAYECETIALHGRANLVNRTDGGDGPIGARHQRSKQYRAKQSRVQRARYRDPAQRDQLRAISMRYARSPEARARLDEHNRRRWADPEQHARLTEQNHKRWADPAERAKLAERNRTPEAREKLRQTRLRQWQDPEYRAKMIAARRRRKNKL